MLGRCLLGHGPLRGGTWVTHITLCQAEGGSLPLCFTTFSGGGGGHWGSAVRVREQRYRERGLCVTQKSSKATSRCLGMSHVASG